jgi:hypothetical protein
MTFAILKSVFMVGVLALAALGSATAAAFIGLAFGLIEMSQVVTAMQQAVDNAQYYVGGLGIAEGLAALRAMRPFVLNYISTWFANVAQRHVTDIVKAQVQEALK